MKTAKEISYYLDGIELGSRDADLRLCNAVAWLCELAMDQEKRIEKAEYLAKRACLAHGFDPVFDSTIRHH